jgi:hypothetical protein
MRSISINEIKHLNPKITQDQQKPAVVDEMAKAIQAFPTQLAEAFKKIPPPVMAARPNGVWIIDVNRDNDGKMSQMRAKFHETKH